MLLDRFDIWGLKRSEPRLFAKVVPGVLLPCDFILSDLPLSGSCLHMWVFFDWSQIGQGFGLSEPLRHAPLVLNVLFCFSFIGVIITTACCKSSKSVRQQCSVWTGRWCGQYWAAKREAKDVLTLWCSLTPIRPDLLHLRYKEYPLFSMTDLSKA